MTQVSDTDLSIIIPVYQVSEELLLRCLKSVQEIQDLRTGSGSLFKPGNPGVCRGSGI